ncbi:MAG: response regulator [Pseudomonadota bacterium]
MEKIRLLLLEDNPGDVSLLRNILAQAKGRQFEVEPVDRIEKGIEKLAEGGVDMILLDLGLQDGDGIEGFLTIHSLYPEIPVVIMIGHDDEETAMTTVSLGAQDFLPKARLDPWFLERSLKYAMERNRLVQQLRRAHSKVKALSGLLPICANCKQIRDDHGYWQKVEEYISIRSDASFTHSLCPQCVQKLYPDVAEPVLEIMRKAGDVFESATFAGGTTVEDLKPGFAGTPTALLVDDDLEILEVITQMMGMMGLEVLTSASGRQAIEMFRRESERIDIVLLDLAMPDMGGEEVFRIMRAIKPDTPVLIFSGKGIETELAGFFTGAKKIEFIKKPCKFKDLAQKMRKLLPTEE